MKEKISHIAPFGFRMPSHVRKWLEQQAQEVDRSMNWVLLRLVEKEMAIRSEYKEAK